MWNSKHNQLNQRTIQCAITLHEDSVTYADVIQRWQTDSDFRTFFIETLASIPFHAFRWETPPLTTTLADRPFEFVVHDSPGLDLVPDEHTFAAHFNSEPEGVIDFLNLGGDAMLIVPCPGDPLSAYGHLAAFVRHASQSQIHTLWSLVGNAMQRRLSDRPVWLSTAGGGVAWLHVRLDDWPKYYGYAPYRELNYWND